MRLHTTVVGFVSKRKWKKFDEGAVGIENSILKECLLLGENFFKRAVVKRCLL